MWKKSITLLILIGQTGCDIEWKQKPEKVKWAMVDTGKLRTTFYDTFKKTVPYPPELLTSDEISRMQELTKKQISQLEQDGRENCRKNVDGSAKSLPNRTDENETIIMPSGEKIIRPKRHQYPSEAVRPTASASNAFYECIANIQKDPLITELQNKLRSVYEANIARGKFDQETRKKFDDFLKTAVDKYAQSKDFQLILNNNPENILYSADKIYIQATDDVIAFISDNQLLTSPADTNLENQVR